MAAEWEDFKPLIALPEVSDVETDGWLSIKTMAKAFSVQRQAVSIRLNEMVRTGRAERKTVFCKCGGSRGRVAFFRKIPESPKTESA